MRWTAVLGSLAINAALLVLMGLVSARTDDVPPPATIEISLIDPVEVAAPPELPATAGGGGGSPGEDGPQAAAARDAHVEPARRIEPQHLAAAKRLETNHVEPQQPPSPWADLDIRYDDATSADVNANAANANASGIEGGCEIESASGTRSKIASEGGGRSEAGVGLRCGTRSGLGNGAGNGNGNGNGSGIGNGSGLGSRGRELRDIAALRVPEPSKARPAKLLHPTRETEVDAAELYVAIVTVDSDGDVVGARMTRSHPGSRGDTAASMIWQFRYSPALDDVGRPVRSTFEQPFAVR